MTNKTIGPWPLGIDNVSRQAAMPAGTLKKAVNVLIDVNGTVSTAAGHRLLPGTDGAHSVWTSKSGTGYCIRAGMLCRIDGDVLVPVATLPSDQPAAFCDLNGEAVICTMQGLSVWSGSTLRPAGLPTPGVIARPVDRGGLNAGRYGVAVSLRSDAMPGMEGGLSSMLMLDIPQGGGIEVDLPTADADKVSVYRTEANGSVLYRAVDAPVGVSGYLIGSGQLGAMPSTANLEELPGGHLVAAWNGLLLVARGRMLSFSAPLRYGLHNPTTDFITLPKKIRMILPVNDGVYLADGDFCYRLAGASPDAWRLDRIDSAPPPIGAAMVVDGALIPEIPAVPVAVWLSSKGFALGLPDGQVVFAQEKRLRLAMPSRSWLAHDGRRLFAGY